jgi:cell division protein FtsB
MLILFVSFLVLFFVLSVNIVNTYEQTAQKDKQLSVLQEEVDKEKKKNDTLVEQEKYYQSDFFIIEEARNILGLAFPNEQLFILKKDKPQNSSPKPDETISNESPAVQEKPNLEKWLDLVFTD